VACLVAVARRLSCRGLGRFGRRKRNVDFKVHVETPTTRRKSIAIPAFELGIHSLAQEHLADSTIQHSTRRLRSRQSSQFEQLAVLPHTQTHPFRQPLHIASIARLIHQQLAVIKSNCQHDLRQPTLQPRPLPWISVHGPHNTVPLATDQFRRRTNCCAGKH
jgi:hypothetical protein